MANGGSRRRPANQRDEPVATLERYSHKNDDGSFTFGYVGADGSFREETRGADCITRGKYGYIDPDGVKREYSYTSGLTCDVDDENNDLDNLENNVVDTVDPKERFRQTQNEQLDDTQIPQIRQQQIRQRTRGNQPTAGPAAQLAPARLPAPVAPQTNTFANFGSQASQGSQAPQGSALQNLLTIADPNVAPAPVQRRPQPTRAPIRIAQRPAAPVQRPAAPVQRPAALAQPTAGTFNFDSELEGFTLNRPAIKFEGNSAAAPAPVKNQFESQLSFNQNTGVFQTSLQQSLPGGAQIRTNNNAAPTGQSATTRLPLTTLAFNPTQRPIQNPTQRPTQPPTQRPTPRAPAILPAGTIQLQPNFKPLNIPQDIGQVKPTPAPLAPTPSEAPRSAAPVTVVPRLTPAPQTAAPAAPAPSVVPAPKAQDKPKGFFVFQPFNQKPASEPFRTPVNPDAFVIKPSVSPAARPNLNSGPALISQGGRPLPVSFPGQPQARPQSPPKQAFPAPQQSFPAQPRPQAFPAPQQPRPAAPIPGAIPQSQLPAGVFAVPAGQPIPAGAIRVNPQGQAINHQGQLIPEQPRRPAPQQQSVRPALQQPIRPASQQPIRPAPQQTIRTAPQQSIRPAVQQPSPGAPQLQFGFQPVSQTGASQQNRPAPFTAFGAGAPQQRAPQFQAQPQQRAPQQLGVPPQLQQQPGQFSQFDSRFAPRPQAAAPQQFRPAQFAPNNFNVFNPTQLRGA